jgi:hypothetical protein
MLITWIGLSTPVPASEASTPATSTAPKAHATKAAKATGAPLKERRCVNVFTHVEQNYKLGKNTIGRLTVNERQQYRAWFIESCLTMDDGVLSCAEKATPIEITDCHEFMAALSVVKRHSGPVDEVTALRIRRRLAEDEPQQLLPRMSALISGMYADRDSQKTFQVVAAGPTPKDSCCDHPDGLCPVVEADWSTPGWKPLGFVPYGPTRYHYAIVPQKKADSFLVRALGDPLCSGHDDVWEIHGHVENGHLNWDEPSWVE